MKTDLPELGRFMENIAREAGNLVIQERQKGLEHQYKAQSELVTQADVAADRYITDSIHARFPGHRILSEENEPDEREAEDLDSPLWIVDPIDGTVNYAYGHPQVAVSIAYAEGGNVVAGVVYAPFVDEMFVGLKGRGACLNGKTIRVSGASDLRLALVATGFPYSKDALAPIVDRLGRVLHECRDIRRIGSAALDICWVACGRLDAYYESVSPWDFAAARVIALEAGARCGHFSDVPREKNPDLWGRDIIVATPAVYETLARLL
ncbi:inositol monophosphatase family protein [Hydrocarboniclastica marina]|uniref:Inositol-1-monophosphatase n=1 Tax=Hydrocarboniclastica marina TaxID=2259620 RepID=A0A4P7XJF3_9ALTE|nr:inositol monophosphatase family protein [Hydrocarboniclastica marina]MAL97353.1 inositol monophosphatase [Alteromonadaceae bacterium]QCF27251.1 inositol monophosphatase [Hydrocarboniclastica marina]|tara:strand:+ start:486 stop:1280 length:795 start_codon:yes stop_codon:yes gene_type:complete